MKSKTICFDLGGVLVKIHHTWNAAAQAAGIKLRPGLKPNYRLTEFVPLEKRQAGELNFDDYLQALGADLGISSEQARQVHAAILVGEYPGALVFVQDLQSAGYKLGCLSNTNAAHWEILMDAAQYPALALLQTKLASHILGVSKPNTAAFAAFTNAVGCAPDDVLFFDDSAENILAAKNLGWNAHRVDPNNPIVEMRRVLSLI